MAKRIAIVDYCKGNLASVARGLSDAGFDARITDAASDIANSDGIVLPGVGAFADAMTTMEATGQADAVRQAVKDGVPFLGICLGLHLLFDWGDEGCPEGERMAGLGVVAGHVERMAQIDAQGKKHKVPHVGWNSVEYAGSDGASAAASLFDGVDDGSYFYFTHSYRAVPDDESMVTAMSVHAQPFVSAVAQGNVFGVQFHPEKSSAAGLRLLENFGNIVESQS